MFVVSRKVFVKEAERIKNGPTTSSVQTGRVVLTKDGNIDELDLSLANSGNEEDGEQSDAKGSKPVNPKTRKTTKGKTNTTSRKSGKGKNNVKARKQSVDGNTDKRDRSWLESENEQDDVPKKRTERSNGGTPAEKKKKLSDAILPPSSDEHPEAGEQLDGEGSKPVNPKKRKVRGKNQSVDGLPNESASLSKKNAAPKRPSFIMPAIKRRLRSQKDN